MEELRRLIQEGFMEIIQSYPDWEKLQHIRYQLQLPLFDGKNVREWVMEIEDYFQLLRLSEEEEFGVACVALDGEAWRWFGLEHERRPFFQWAEMKVLLVLRFGSSPEFWQAWQAPARFGNLGSLTRDWELVGTTTSCGGRYREGFAKGESKARGTGGCRGHDEICGDFEGGCGAKRDGFGVKNTQNTVVNIKPKEEEGDEGEVEEKEVRDGETFHGGHDGAVVVEESIGYGGGGALDGGGLSSDGLFGGRRKGKVKGRDGKYGGGSGAPAADESRGGHDDMEVVEESGGDGSGGEVGEGRVVGCGSGGGPGTVGDEKEGGAGSGEGLSFVAGVEVDKGSMVGSNVEIGLKGEKFLESFAERYMESLNGSWFELNFDVGTEMKGGSTLVSDGVNSLEDERFSGSLTGNFTSLQEKEVVGGIGTSKGNLGNGLKSDLSAEVGQIVSCDSVVSCDSDSDFYLGPKGSNDDILKKFQPRCGFTNKKPNFPFFKPKFSKPKISLPFFNGHYIASLFRSNSLTHLSKLISSHTCLRPISHTEFQQPKLSNPHSINYATLFANQPNPLSKPNCIPSSTVPPDHKVTIKFHLTSCNFQGHFTIAVRQEMSITHGQKQQCSDRKFSNDYRPP